MRRYPRVQDCGTIPGEQAAGGGHRGKKLWAYRPTRAAAPAPRLCPVTTSFHSRQSMSRSCRAASCVPRPGSPTLRYPPSRIYNLCIYMPPGRGGAGALLESYLCAAGLGRQWKAAESAELSLQPAPGLVQLVAFC